MLPETTTNEAAPLFCKPLPSKDSGQSLYTNHSPKLNGEISFRSLTLDTDIHTIHDWVNRPYTKRFWQLNGDRGTLLDTYMRILSSHYAHSYIGSFNGKNVCQVDLYVAGADELINHVHCEPNDCGLHLLMCPPEQMIKGITIAMLREFWRFYFLFPQAERIFAEPDIQNALANKLARDAGFYFLKTIQMSYKTANLYSLTRTQFESIATQ
jgi:RimJ/RimL family protein N-acetyltransferase